jgi:hypothetical protein
VPFNIVSVGIYLGCDEVEYLSFNKRASLLDWDVILFYPDIKNLIERDYGDTEYNGKLSLKNTKSFELKEACAHWRREILQAVRAGKLVVSFLNKFEQVYVATGSTSTSGSGRNQKVTRHVELISNYSSLPVELNWIETQGSSMILHTSAKDLLSAYWRNFGAQSRYNVVWDNNSPGTIITTRHGQKPVGLLNRDGSGGALVLLPELDLERAEYYEHDEDGDEIWSKAGEQFSRLLVTEIVSLAKAIANESEKTPEPAWALSEQFLLAREVSLKKDLLLAEENVETAQRHRQEIIAKISETTEIKGLLYEKGHALELAIVGALKILGFKAEQYHNGNSEFDVVFECKEGRLLGEAEGKDTKAINIDKLRQLSMNIHEDLQREEVTTPAKGVLFGNGYRLADPRGRQPQFTEKCISAAKSTSIALVSTDQLYAAAKYLSDKNDSEYAKACRISLVSGVGLTSLPATPALDDTSLQ